MALVAEMDLKNYEIESGEKRRFSCKRCNVVCSSRYGLTEHLRKHTGDRPFSCTQCNHSFKRMMGLRKHQQSIHGAPGLKQFKCPECKLISTNLGNVVRHYLVVHRTLRRFICSVCLAQYSQNQELKTHVSAKHNVTIDNINSREKKSICEIYVLPHFDPKDRTETIKRRLKEIVEQQKEKLEGLEKFITFIKNSTNNDNLNDNNETNFPLSETSTSVTIPVDVPSNSLNDKENNNIVKDVEESVLISGCDNSDLELHKSCPETWISFVLERPTIICDEVCCNNSTSTSLLANNQENEQKTEETIKLSVIPDDIQWKCEICSKTFSEEKKLFRHFKIHCNVKQYKCDRCEKSFHEQYNLVVHQRTHTGERPYICPACGKKIRYHKDLVDHFVSHSGEKKYSCGTCSKKFPRKRDCDRHMLSHNSEHKFSCEICGKGFSRRYLMMNHVIKHKKNENQLATKKQLYECDVCRKHYKTLQGYQQHKTKHTGMTEHQCHICSKSFISATRLQAHLRNHIPRVKNVTCSECQRKFSSHDTLKENKTKIDATCSTTSI
ncbi:uncharacterized protein LOC142334237 isoform X2 [Lycorma delicatula]|uniref:uncharacterized protein LOC142334237 isoform X2 n=1 Tax=Lycorma delicatula TaxID=130591 RepID=UPI003F517069